MRDEEKNKTNELVLVLGAAIYICIQMYAYIYLRTFIHGYSLSHTHPSMLSLLGISA